MDFTAAAVAVAVLNAAAYLVALAAFARASNRAALALADHRATLDALAEARAERDAARTDALAANRRAESLAEAEEAARLDARAAYDNGQSEREHAAHLFAVAGRYREALCHAHNALSSACAGLADGSRATLDAALPEASAALLARKNETAEAAVRASLALSREGDMLDAKRANGSR